MFFYRVFYLSMGLKEKSQDFDDYMAIASQAYLHALA